MSQREYDLPDAALLAELPVIADRYTCPFTGTCSNPAAKVGTCDAESMKYCYGSGRNGMFLKRFQSVRETIVDKPKDCPGITRLSQRVPFYVPAFRKKGPLD